MTMGSGYRGRRRGAGNITQAGKNKSGRVDTGLPALLRLFGRGVIFACVLRDDILARARLCDPKALAAIERMMPADVPRRELSRQRNEHLRAIAMKFRADQLKISERALARLLAEAGARLHSPRGRLEDVPPFDVLDSEERKMLADESKYPPAEPGALGFEPLKAAVGCLFSAFASAPSLRNGSPAGSCSSA
jgi:hypothetical protein